MGRRPKHDLKTGSPTILSTDRIPASTRMPNAQACKAFATDKLWRRSLGQGGLNIACKKRDLYERIFEFDHQGHW